MRPTLRRVNLEMRQPDPNILLEREWLVTNGLGGYSSSTISGISTRKYHGLLVAAVPAPHGRMMMLTDLREEICFEDGVEAELGGELLSRGDLLFPGGYHLKEFVLENGLPVWRYRVNGMVIEKRIMLPHFQNSVYINYRLVSEDSHLLLRLRPFMQFRVVHDEISSVQESPYNIHATGDRYEVVKDPQLPRLRLYLYGDEGSFNLAGGYSFEKYYQTEERRGYPARGWTWNPGFFQSTLSSSKPTTLVASTDPWEVMLALDPHSAMYEEMHRRQRLLFSAGIEGSPGIEGELVLAADQFIIMPASRTADATRARARGDQSRTVVAGYHWFTDWGRDSMISLEGLCLSTGRSAEAGYILRTFVQYVRDGLIPNMFPEGQTEGMYNTADATLWFFHAVDRYVQASSDHITLRQLLPALTDIITHHIHGTRFGIAVDLADGLLRQGDPGVALTWMDAKADDWIITPRRGKAVEINALWYNALRLLQKWLIENRNPRQAERFMRLADRVYESFNRKFWHSEERYLYDIIDGESGADPALRPNQLFAISLPNPVLAPSRWERVLSVIQERLLTPVGLRSLGPRHPDYKGQYRGDLLARDAAYHQGSVWSWLLGPFVDAWLKVYPDDHDGAATFLNGLISHLDDACIGSVSELFDGEPPFRHEGCISQAWSVAELLRAWKKINKSR